MDPNYIDQIKDDRLESLLVRPENVEAVEELLHEKKQELAGLKALRREKKLKFGKKIKEENLPYLLAEVKTEVDNFLDITGISQPGCVFSDEQKMIELCFGILNVGLNGFGIAIYSSMVYNSVLAPVVAGATLTAAVLRINKTSREVSQRVVGSVYSSGGNEEESISCYYMDNREHKLRSTLAHEYAHHVQNVVMGEVFNYRKIFIEGHARGVARHIRRIYSERNDDPSHLYPDLQGYDVGELSDVYLWLCRKFDQTPNRKLVGLRRRKKN